jgi:transglutaminase-like putative cysteine protease
LFASGDFTVLLIAIGLLTMPALALNQAGWPLSLRILLPVTVLSVLFGILLARSQYNEMFALIIAAMYGACFVMLFTALQEPGGLGQGAYNIFVRTLHWLVDAATGGINQDDVVFTLLIATLFWFLGYNAAWHLFRLDRVWRVILPPGLILAINSVFYSGAKNLDGYLIGFLFLALLLIVRSNLDSREWDWYVNGIRVPRSLRQQFLRVGAVLAVVALLIAWTIPIGDLQRQLDSFQNFLHNDPLTQIAEFWNRLFAPIDTQGPVTSDYYGGDSLQLGGAIRLGDQTVFLVSAPPVHRYYWRSRVFDVYENGRWTPAADIRLVDPDAPFDVNLTPDLIGGARESVQQEFTMGLSASRLIYTAPQPSEVNLGTRADLRYLNPLTKEGMNISVIRPIRVLYQGDTYKATSLLSVATADQLRAASTDYPQWVRDLYINQLSTSVTTRTTQLAKQIVAQAGAATPYDKAKAVERWLRANIKYNETIPQPPTGQDPVDWVLFDMKQGYCTYYASAMIVMLRSLGIPARMAAGFAQGTWDPDNQVYNVKERDAHIWVETFFPGYGWVEFEPTAAQAPLDRIGDAPSPQPPTPPPAGSPPPTETPTATATPLPTSTPDASSGAPQQLPSVTPSITPTFTPSPTATPVIIPTAPPPIRPQPRGLLSFLLPALALALVGLFLLILLIAIGVFIWWWWEWRGMRGLSPISRAYARLERYVGLLGIRLQPQQTPEERRRRIARDLPRAERPVTAITRLYTAERYGRSPASSEATPNGQAADQAWSDARGTILQRFLRRRFLPWSKQK